MSEAFQQSLLTAIPIIITSIASAIVAVRQSNKKTIESAAKTNELVVNKTDETRQKLAEVHETVNGNYTALQAKYDAVLVENQMLREQLAQRAAKRATDP